MEHDSTPTAVGSNAGLGLDSGRAAFEAWYSDGGRYPQSVERAGNGYKLMGAHSAWTAWEACWPLAQAAERERCVRIVEAHQVPVGNSAAGEMAAEWTMDALREIRDAIRGPNA